jgi:hypothetical protein
MPLTDRRFLLSIAPCVLGAVLSLPLGTAALAAAQPTQADRSTVAADRVVVAMARRVTSAWRETEHGDRIIVSQVLLEIEESLKGGGPSSALLEVEGGTVDGFTLRVSGLELIEVGERAVVFMDAVEGGRHVPHARGEGILKLDSDNGVRGSQLRLDDIRSRVRGGGF